MIPGLAIAARYVPKEQWECFFVGHDFGDKARATCNEINGLRVITVYAECRICKGVFGRHRNYMPFANERLNTTEEKLILGELRTDILNMDRSTHARRRHGEDVDGRTSDGAPAEAPGP